MRVSSALAPARASTLLWGLLGALLLVRLVSLALVPVADSSEARYADIGRRMLELGDWVTPWFDDGVPFWGKPPLYTWMTAGGMGVFGVNGFGARVGHFLAGVGVALVVWDWQRREHGRAQAQLAVVLLWAAALYYLCAGAVLTDTRAPSIGISAALSAPSMAAMSSETCRSRVATVRSPMVICSRYQLPPKAPEETSSTWTSSVACASVSVLTDCSMPIDPDALNSPAKPMSRSPRTRSNSPCTPAMSSVSDLSAPARTS